MNYYAEKNETQRKSSPGHYAYDLLTQVNGCVNGCCTGLSYYYDTEFPPEGFHEDQEGFIVLSGMGVVKIGQTEFKIYKGISFIVPANTNHSIKTLNKNEPVEVFWFHAAV